MLINKTNAWPWKRVHFVGIGGAGMAALARLALDCGLQVTGSDAKDSFRVDMLRSMGAEVKVGHDAKMVSSDTGLVVYSSAVGSGNPELRHAAELGLETVCRGAFLARFASRFDTVFAVAGSHGKTTTTAMLVHMLEQVGMRASYLIGADTTGGSPPSAFRSPSVFVTEVDESDGTQEMVKNAIAVITNVDDDHCWRFGGREELEACFVRFARASKSVIAWQDANTQRILTVVPEVLWVDEKKASKLESLALPGPHNRQNAAVALSAFEFFVQDEKPEKQASELLAGFSLPDRRFQQRFAWPDQSFVIVEDYAHHPRELQALQATVEQVYPEHFVHIVFQPHRFERVKRYAGDFAALLDRFDAVTLLPPFSAWVDNGETEASRQILKLMHNASSVRYDDGELDVIAARLVAEQKSSERPFLTLIVGAGDVSALVGLLATQAAAEWRQQMAVALKAAVDGIEVEVEKSWAELTSLCAGLGKPLLVFPKTVEQLKAVLCEARRHCLIGRTIGNGTNLIGSDRDSLDLFIKLTKGCFTDVSVDNGEVRCGAGVSLSRLVRMLIDDRQLPAKAAPLGWIPASVGGAIWMNAWADGVALSQYVLRISGVDQGGQSWEKTVDEILWGYRETSLPKDTIITHVSLEFNNISDACEDTSRLALEEVGKLRRNRQPAGASAGSVFRNPGDQAAGRLLERAGCKGLALGEFYVSDLHANVILNHKKRGASEHDVVSLMMQMRDSVQRMSGIRLKTEVSFVDPQTRDMMERARPPLNVVVLKGGPSMEREVSLRSGAAVAQALRDSGHTVTEVDVREAALPKLPPGTDVVFPALHGAFGEDGTVQRLLEQAGVPYVGSGAEASQCMMDKQATKSVLADNGLPLADGFVVESTDVPVPAADWFPLVVKPNAQGSTVGMTRLLSPEDGWQQALYKAFETDDQVLVERFVKGIELTVSVINGHALPPVEIIPPEDRIFDYDAKYQHKEGHTRYICPPESLSDEMIELLCGHAEASFSVLGAKDLLRIDFILSENGPYILEANSIPGFTETSLVPKSASVVSISFVELCAGLVWQQLPAAVTDPFDHVWQKRVVDAISY